MTNEYRGKMENDMYKLYEERKIPQTEADLEKLVKNGDLIP